MTLIQGKDFAFDLPDRVLVVMAVRQLHEAGEKITAQSVAECAGISVDEAREEIRQLKAEQEGKRV